MARKYWITLFTVDTWKEFLAHGGDVAGFSESSWRSVQRISVGDYLLCYITGAQRLTGVLEAAGQPFRSSERIWTADTYPCRLPVRGMELIEQPEYGIPIVSMRDKLTIFENPGNPNAWSMRVRRSPTQWTDQDGEAVLTAVRSAKINPQRRPLKSGSSSKGATPRSRVIETEGATLTIPFDGAAASEPAAEPSLHTEIQYMLLKLGADMGFDVHVARNDLRRTYDGKHLADLPRLRGTLPDQFDENTSKIIKLIDVLWLNRNSIKAAFEIESTTAIYSGLLRMTDLLTLQPNLSIPLFLVSHEAWRNKVIEQINRPTFAHGNPPLNEVCRFIAFERLRAEIEKMGQAIRHLKFDWLQDLSESCHPSP